jgi:hypothetical protein
VAGLFNNHELLNNVWTDMTNNSECVPEEYQLEILREQVTKKTKQSGGLIFKHDQLNPYNLEVTVCTK